MNIHWNVENVDICHRVCALYHKMALRETLCFWYLTGQRGVTKKKKRKKKTQNICTLYVDCFCTKDECNKNGKWPV